MAHKDAAFKVRVFNQMYGYERDQVVTIVADSVEAALAEAESIDRFASVSIVSLGEPKDE